jgi:hypothetical protein
LNKQTKQTNKQTNKQHKQRTNKQTTLRLLQLVKSWCYKLDCVELVHITLRADESGHKILAEQMAADYGVSREEQGQLTYQAALQQARHRFINIPHMVQNSALKAFLSVRLSYLTPGIALGVRHAGAHSFVLLDFMFVVVVVVVCFCELCLLL